MSDESTQSEVERLRAEVESYRQRELADLRSALAAEREQKDNYRSEAYRISEAARQLSQEYELKLRDWQIKYDALTEMTRDARRRT